MGSCSRLLRARGPRPDVADVDQAKVDARWHAEYRRRIDDMESKRVQLVSHEETVSQARAKLAARRE